jgi:hypothetical protein
VDEAVLLLHQMGEQLQERGDVATASQYFAKAKVVLEHGRPIRAIALDREQLGSDDPALAPSHPEQPHPTL